MGPTHVIAPTTPRPRRRREAPGRGGRAQVESHARRRVERALSRTSQRPRAVDDQPPGPIATMASEVPPGRPSKSGRSSRASFGRWFDRHVDRGHLGRPEAGIDRNVAAPGRLFGRVWSDQRTPDRHEPRDRMVARGRQARPIRWRPGGKSETDSGRLPLVANGARGSSGSPHRDFARRVHADIDGSRVRLDGERRRCPLEQHRVCPQTTRDRMHIPMVMHSSWPFRHGQRALQPDQRDARPSDLPMI